MNKDLDNIKLTFWQEFKTTMRFLVFGLRRNEVELTEFEVGTLNFLEEKLRLVFGKRAPEIRICKNFYFMGEKSSELPFDSNNRINYILWGPAAITVGKNLLKIDPKVYLATFLFEAASHPDRNFWRLGEILIYLYYLSFIVILTTLFISWKIFLILLFLVISIRLLKPLFIRWLDWKAVKRLASWIGSENLFRIWKQERKLQLEILDERYLGPGLRTGGKWPYDQRPTWWEVNQYLIKNNVVAKFPKLYF